MRHLIIIMFVRKQCRLLIRGIHTRHTVIWNIPRARGSLIRGIHTRHTVIWNIPRARGSLIRVRSKNMFK